MALEQLSIVVGAVVGFWTGFLTRDSKAIDLYPPQYSRFTQSLHHGHGVCRSSFSCFLPLCSLSGPCSSTSCRLRPDC